MTLAELRQIEARSVIPSYARQPVEFVRGEGVRLWDDEGNEYLDFLCGISVTNLGHCHPRVVAAVREQVGRLMHVSNLFYTEPAMRLADRLAQSSLGGKAYLCNSGAEATEAAIKLARKAKPQGDVVVVHGAFHGRTYGALAATPRLLLLDEVAGGLTDPEMVALVDVVRRARAGGVAIIWIEHVVRALMQTVDRLICLAGGKFIGDGEPAEVLASAAVKEVFLGTEATAESLAEAGMPEADT